MLEVTDRRGETLSEGCVVKWWPKHEGVSPEFGEVIGIVSEGRVDWRAFGSNSHRSTHPNTLEKRRTWMPRANRRTPAGDAQQKHRDLLTAHHPDMKARPWRRGRR